MKINFRKPKLSKTSLSRLNTINNIIDEYQSQGYTLTLRQLYYQLVSRDIIPNKQAEYSKLSTVLKEGRMGGIVDWDAIEDRLRQPYTPPSWSSPKEIIDGCISQYALPRMEGQPKYLEVWVEKDALSGVLKRVTSKYHIPILVNRGYSSVSAMFDSFERFESAVKNKQDIVIIYLGDFDPSGLDMIRDIEERSLEFLLNSDLHWDIDVDNDEYEKLEFKYHCDNDCIDWSKDEDGQEWNDFRIGKAWLKEHFSVVPVALTQEQIAQYNPPPNPAKLTDPRAQGFISEFGNTSWEVDALTPQVLNGVLDGAIKDNIDIDKYNGMVSREEDHKDTLRELRDNL